MSMKQALEADAPPPTSTLAPLSGAEDASPIESMVAEAAALSGEPPLAAPRSRALSWRERVVPIIVASPLFLQNLDTSVMATALPSIAESLQVEPLHLNLAITAYLLSLAVFLPISGWCAERFGARRVFCAAIAFFALGSALCGAATSLGQLVVFRIVQGLGGAMMVPVGRLILLRSVPQSLMVSAMVWFTVPPVIGRMAGPLFGGAIVTWTSWRWIFLINVPCGLLGIAMALLFVPDKGGRLPGETPPPFDTKGFIMLAVALTGLLGALELFGKGMVAPWFVAVLALVGAAALGLYIVLSRLNPEPVIDLAILKYTAFRASVIGGMPLRVAVGASPFLLPLMLQIGFGLSAMESGTLTVATAVGALLTRMILSRLVKRLRFRTLIIGATVMSSFCYACYGLFTHTTPHVLMFAVMTVGGLINSIALVSLGTMGFAAIPRERMSHATSLSTMCQQLSVSLGVVIGAALVALTAWWRGGDSAHLMENDFHFAFFAIGAWTLLSLLSFTRLDRDEGSELR